MRVLTDGHKGIRPVPVQCRTDGNERACQPRVGDLIMTLTPALSRQVATLVEPEPRTSAVALCPMCHTTDVSLTEDLLEAGCDWLCVRCGQRWDAARLRTVRAYAEWTSGHDE